MESSKVDREVLITNVLTQGSIDIGWTSADCTLEDAAQSSASSSATPEAANEQQKPNPTRVHVGCDGVKVPVVTQAEKTKRRDTIELKRRRSGKKCRPLPAARAGSDQQYKEARIVVADNESQTRRLIIATRGDCEVTGRLLRSMATTIKLDEATESIANIDGAPWIRKQLEFHNIVDEINMDYYHMKDNAQKGPSRNVRR